MKTISWEKFNTHNEEETEEPSFGSLIMSTNQIGSNINQYEDFNLFIGHCNFYIGRKTVNILCEIEGIESLDILSPYRFRIGIGKLFEIQKTLDNITKTLTEDKNESLQ